MKLSDHVDKIRNLITSSFDKQFARLGIGANTQIELEKLPEQVRGKRQRLEVMLENHIGETGCYQNAREKLLDELSFTLFNRLAAVKVMESANLFPPVITKQAEHGGRSFGHKAWLEDYPEKRENELEGIRDYFKHAFNELGDSLSLYSKEYPYALLPDAISLNEIVEAFNVIAEDSQVEDDIWQSDDVLGWLYESYNNAKKQAFKDSKAKTEFDKVSLQSQIYTPRWVVQFLVENSLGKLYLEMYPESDIKNQFKIANAPKIQERDLKPLHEIKLIDPASGSGNFLLYAFDFFYALYIDQIENYDADYDEDDIPKLIIENNLYGIDLDDRAIQLAQLGLYIKARKKRRFIKGSFKFKVVSSDFYLPEYDAARHIFEDDDKLDNTQKELIEDIWNDLRYAYKFGSLIRLDEKLKTKLKELEAKQGDRVLDLFADADIREQKDFTESFFNNLKSAVEQYASKDTDTFITSKTRDAITFLELLTTEYDVACANPPYTDSSDFGKDLKTYIDINFKKPKFNTNLYAVFVKRCYELVKDGGKIALIHPDTFMFIKTFEDVRKFILSKTSLNVMAHFGAGGIFGTRLRVVFPAIYVLEKTANKKPSMFIDLRSLKMNEELERKTLATALDDHNYTLIDQSKFSNIPSNPFIYWISDAFREKFKTKNFDHYFKLATGLMTGNNLKNLRYHWEVDCGSISKNYIEDRKRWVPYQKGGDSNSWYGNNWLVVNYEGDGAKLATTDNKAFYFKDGITYSATGAKVAFRKLPPNQIFDKKGSCIFSKAMNKEWNLDYVLSLLNSKFTTYVVGCLNSTVETQVGDIKRVPFVTPKKVDETLLAKLGLINVNINQHLNEFSIVEKDYISSPLNNSLTHGEFKKSAQLFMYYENCLNALISLNESLINRKVFEIYTLNPEDIEKILAKEGALIGEYPICNEAKSSFMEYLDNIDTKYVSDELITYINELPLLESTQEKRSDLEVIFPEFYQRGTDILSVCSTYKVNPINLWYWFKQSKALPKGKMKRIALEYLIDILSGLLIDDNDGVIPLSANASETPLLKRIENKFYQMGLGSAQLSSFGALFKGDLSNYLYQDFFNELSNILNLFMYQPKTPYIWHLTSGPERGFDCYISIYKWSRDNLMRIRSVYIEHRERALINRQSDLANNESVDAQNEKDKIFKQLKEIEVFKVKIDELLEEGYDPILDDGVGKNIAPLQQKKMLAYDVLNAGQLKKYLNADW
jgi:hypothetical protein